MYLETHCNITWRGRFPPVCFTDDTTVYLFTDATSPSCDVHIGLFTVRHDSARRPRWLSTIANIWVGTFLVRHVQTGKRCRWQTALCSDSRPAVVYTDVDGQCDKVKLVRCYNARLYYTHTCMCVVTHVWVTTHIDHSYARCNNARDDLLSLMSGCALQHNSDARALLLCVVTHDYWFHQNNKNCSPTYILCIYFKYLNY